MRRRAVRSRRGRDETGVALMIVMLLLALLVTIVAEFAQAMRLEALTATNFRAAVAETWVAQAGHQRALAEILPEALAHELDLGGALAFRRVRRVVPQVPERVDVALNPGRLSYRLTDENSRLNLNLVTRDVLDRLLQDLALEKSARDVIIDSIQDWRDPNEAHRLNGAESDYYQTLPVPYRSKNANFDTVDELLQVRGVTRQILYGRPEAPGLIEHLTAWGNGAVNVNTASPAVLRAIGFAPAEIDLLTSRRPYVDLGELPPGLRRGRLQTRSDTFRVEAWAGGPTPAGRVLTVVVERRAEAGQIEAVPLAWRWSEAQRPVTPAPAESRGARTPS